MRKFKGFLGPVGDDIPTIIIIALAIALFFSGFSQAMLVYSQKKESLTLLQASLDVSRALLKSNVLPKDLGSSYGGYAQAELVAESYGVNFKASYKNVKVADLSKAQPCPDEAQNRQHALFSYLVPRYDDSGGIVLDTLRVCVWK